MEVHLLQECLWKLEVELWPPSPVLFPGLSKQPERQWPLIHLVTAGAVWQSGQYAHLHVVEKSEGYHGHLQDYLPRIMLAGPNTTYYSVHTQQ